MKLLFISILFLASFSSCIFSDSSAETILRKNGLRLGVGWKDFKLVENLNSDPEDIFTLKNSRQEILRILFFHGLERDQAIKIAQSRSLAVRSLFASRDVPYIGKVSKTESCLSLNKVFSEIEGTEYGFSLLFQLMATKLYVYGSCSEADDYYKSRYMIKYCQKSKTLVEAKLFTEKSQEFSDSNDVIECE